MPAPINRRSVFPLKFSTGLKVYTFCRLWSAHVREDRTDEQIFVSAVCNLFLFFVRIFRLHFRSNLSIHRRIRSKKKSCSCLFLLVGISLFPDQPFLEAFLRRRRKHQTGQNICPNRQPSIFSRHPRRIRIAQKIQMDLEGVNLQSSIHRLEYGSKSRCPLASRRHEKHQRNDGHVQRLAQKRLFDHAIPRRNAFRRR